METHGRMEMKRGPRAWWLGWLIWGTLAHAGCRHASEHPQVTLKTRQGSEIRVRVEVVSNPQDRAQGLMFRKHLEPDAGMLFVYPYESVLSFWMKNTYLSLDMLFISANKRVVGIIEEARPLSLDSRKVETPSQYVLEVPAGFVRRHQVRLGDLVDWIEIIEIKNLSCGEEALRLARFPRGARLSA